LINGRAAGQERMRPGGAAIVRQIVEERIFANDVVGIGAADTAPTSFDQRVAGMDGASKTTVDTIDTTGAVGDDRIVQRSSGCAHDHDLIDAAADNCSVV